jgi:monoamine oxidase
MDQAEVAIVGAGAADLATANLLRMAGVDVLLLYARDRIGGRTHTDLAIAAAPFDPGASYIHAADQGNPWLGIARGLDEPIVRDPRRRAILHAGQHVAIAPYDVALKDAWRRLKGADGAAGAHLPDATLAQRYARALAGPWLSGVACAVMDAADFVAARDGEDWLVPGGYGRLVAATGTGLPVRLACPVLAVRSLHERVELETAHGTLRAAQAVITVPLGVLAAERIRFDPSLSPPVLAALDGLHMGNLVKLRVTLDGDPLGLPEGTYVTAPPADERSVLWLARPFGRLELMGFAGGSHAAELAALTPEALRAEVGRLLAAIAGGDAARRVVACTIADWLSDPFSLGSYAIARPGAASARASLRQPFTERIRPRTSAGSSGNLCRRPASTSP